MQPGHQSLPGFPRNNLRRKTFRLFHADDAIASQSGNLTNEKLKIAVEQAFSLWSAVAQLNFVADPNGNLAGGRDEAKAVAAGLRSGAAWEIRTLEGEGATRGALLDELARSQLFHYAGHGIFAGADGGGGDDPRGRPAQRRDVPAELFRLPEPGRRERVLGRPAVVGTARRVAVAGQQKPHLLHVRRVRLPACGVPQHRPEGL